MNQKMKPFIVSHYTSNAGTTDAYQNYLDSMNIQYLLLKHPYNDPTLKYSIFVNNLSGKKNLKKINRSKNKFVDYLKASFLNIYLLIYQRRNYDAVIAFGIYDGLICGLVCKVIRKKSVYWGVDYHQIRSSYAIINKAFHSLETFACIINTYVASSSKSQEIARIKHHHLSRKNSLLIPNVPIATGKKLKWKKGRKIAYVYFGSIDKEHGILEFIKLNYLEKNKNELNDFHIYGNGPDSIELKKIIKKNNFNIFYHGRIEPKYLSKHLSTNNLNFIGIAPYSGEGASYTNYGDSLKIKEYVSMYIPYFCTGDITIDDSLKKYGIAKQYGPNLLTLDKNTLNLIIKIGHNMSSEKIKIQDSQMSNVLNKLGYNK